MATLNSTDLVEITIMDIRAHLRATNSYICNQNLTYFVITTRKLATLRTNVVGYMDFLKTLNLPNGKTQPEPQMPMKVILKEHLRSVQNSPLRLEPKGPKLTISSTAG